MTTTRRTDKKVTETYLFTFSPKGNTKNAEFTYYDDLATYFNSWHRCMSEFEINPEFNQNGNLHYHGYFVLKDKVKWYKIVLPKMKYNGMVKINKVEHDLSSAMIYCRKDNELMLHIIRRYPIPYTHQDKLFRLDIDDKPNDIYKYLKDPTHKGLKVGETTTDLQDEVNVLDFGLEGYPT